MKRIGVLGGMSWESSAEYYRMINELVAERLGGYHSADIVMVSVDFDPIEQMQREARWDDAAAVLVEAARACERAGAECLLLATNTMHIVFDELEAATEAPWIHIVDPTARAAKAYGTHVVGLLGTTFTMEQPFYRERLEKRFGLKVVIPDADDRVLVHRVIFDELVRGVIRAESRRAYTRVAGRLVDKGAEAVILGCTEIGMLLREEDVPVPALDTTTLHAEAAVGFALT
ncbi:MAG: aspartate/glutamate racemase family protein [Spirochaetaceae bacterium]